MATCVNSTRIIYVFAIVLRQTTAGPGRAFVAMCGCCGVNVCIVFADICCCFLLGHVVYVLFWWLVIVDVFFRIANTTPEVLKPSNCWKVSGAVESAVATHHGVVIYIYIFIWKHIYHIYIYIHKYYRDYEMCSKVFAASVHSPCTAFTLSVAPSDLALADTGRLWLWHQALLDRIACHGHALARALPAGPAALARKTSRPGEMIWYRIVLNI